MTTRHPTPELTLLASKQRQAEAQFNALLALPSGQWTCSDERDAALDTAARTLRATYLAYEAADREYSDSLKMMHAQSHTPLMDMIRAELEAISADAAQLTAERDEALAQCDALRQEVALLKGLLAVDMDEEADRLEATEASWMV